MLSTSTINLTTQGTADWADWAAVSTSDFNHKSTGLSQISNYTLVGSYTPIVDNPNTISVSWTDGTPTASKTTNNCLGYPSTVGTGFSFTVPADATQRTLKVYVGVYTATAKIVAHLSDGSAADFTNTGITDSSTGSTFANGVATLTYTAASAGQTLTVTVTVNSTNNTTPGIALMAATLAQAAPTVTSISPSVGATRGGIPSTVITGTNLSNVTSVTFGGTAATITANTATSVTVTTPAHAAGAVTVAVTTSGGSANTSYTYYDPIWSGGGADANWTTAANWGNTLVPQTTDDVTFGSAFTSGTTVQLNGAQTANSATVSTTANIALDSASAVNLTLTSGSLTKTSASTGTTTFNANAKIALGANAAWANSGGLLTVNSIVSGAYSLTTSGTGTIALGGVNAYTGATTVSAGKLLLSGSLASGSAVTVASGATLAGSGTAAGTVSVSGTIAPGNGAAGTLSTGALTLNSGSTLSYFLNTTGASSKIASTGAITLGGTLNITAGGSFGVGTYTLMTCTGTPTGSLTLGTVPAGYAYAITVASGSVSVVVSVPVPTSLAVTEASATSAALTWSAVTGATSYNLYRSTTSNGEGSTPVQTGLTGTSYTNTGLTSGTTYYYKLTAVAGSAESPQSSEVSITILAIPTGVTGTTSSTTPVILSWSAVTGATSYYINRGTASGAETSLASGITSTSYNDTTAIRGTTYYYYIGAANYPAYSGGSSEVVVDPINTSSPYYQITSATNSASPAISPFAADAYNSDINNYSDQRFWGNTTINVTAPNAAPQAVYQNEQNSVGHTNAGTPVTYTLPGLTPGGSYVVRLHFSEGYYTSAGNRLFNVAINGTSVLSQFDVYVAAAANQKAVVRNFNATANGSGNILVVFSNGTADQFEINGLEILGGSVTAAPASLAAAQASATSASLTWAAVSGATSYNLYRSTTAGYEGSTPVQTGLTGTSYTNTGLTNGTTYYYKLTAVNAQGESALSSEVTYVPLGIPTNLAVSEASATSAALTWSAVTGATSYNLYRSTTSNGEGSTPVQTGLTGTSYTNTGLTSGTTYYYKLTAVTATSESTQSSEVSITILATPTGVTGTTSSTTPVILSWSAVTGATSYYINRGTASGAETSLASGITSTSYNDTTAIRGTTYYYYIGAANYPAYSVGSSEVVVDPINTSSPYYQITSATNSASPAISPFAADAYNSDINNYSDQRFWGNTTINVTAPNAAPQAVYQNEQNSVGHTNAGTPVTYTLPGLTPGGSYVVRLHFSEGYYTSAGNRLFNVAINGTSVLSQFDVYVAAAANQKAVVRNFNATANGSGNILVVFSNGTADQFEINGLEILGGSVTAAPASLAATQASATSASLTWGAVSGATSYNLYRSTTAGYEGSTPVQTGLTGTSYTNTGLTSGTTYYYKLTAVNAQGESALSSEVTYVPLGIPTSLAVTVASATSAALTWSAVTGATSYNLYRSTTAGGEGSTPIQTGLTGTSYTNTGLTSGTTYYYKLTATTVTSESAQSSEVSVTPVGVPTNVVATPGNAQVSLSWTAAAGATSYNVLRGTTPGGAYTQVGTPSSAGYTDATAANNTTYFYVVQAVSAGSTSANSSEVAATPGGANGLLGWWKLDENTGTSVSDGSGFSNTGTFTSAGWATGRSGYAGSFNGSSSVVDMGKGVIATANSFTLACWVKLNSMSGYQTFISQDGTTVSGFYLQTQGTGNPFRFLMDPSDGPSAGISVNSLAVPVIGTWYHLIGVYDAPNSQIKLYVNGTLQGTTAFTTPWSATGNTVIGRGKYGGSPTDLVNGYIDDVRIYNRLLTAAEIATISAYPTGVTTAQASATSATISWTAFPSATSYNLYRSTTAGTEGGTPIQTGLTGTSYTNTGLTSGTTYYYKLSATTASGESAQSNEVTLTPVAAPTSLAVTQASATSSTLTWTAVTGATSYNLYRSTTAGGEGATPVQTGLTGTSYTNTGLTNGTTYYYKLTAVTATSESSQSSEATYVPLAVPTSLAVTQASATSSTLTWAAVTGATSYNLYRSTTSNGEGATPIQTGLTGTSYTNTGLTSGTTYYYKLTAVNAVAESGQSTEVSLTPVAAPTGLAVTEASATSSSLTWTAVTGATSYNLYRSTTAGGEGSTPVQTGLTGTSYTNTGLTTNTTYYYKLTAVTATSESAQSSEVSLTPIATPTSLAVTQASATSSTLTWAAVTGATSYNLYRSTTAGGEGSTPVQTGLTGTSYTNTGLTSGTTYYYKLTAVTATSESPQSTEVSLTPLTAPTSLAVAQASATSSTLTWTAVTGATSYNLYRSTTAGGEGSTPIQTGLTGTSYTNTGLTSGTTYYYKLTAVNATAESTQSTEVSLTPVAAPTGLAVTQASATSAALTWTAVTGATSYNLYRSTTAGGEGATPIQTSLTGTSYTNTGLTSGTTYYYKLTAVTATSESAQSSEASLTPIAPPAAPTALTAVPGNTSVTLSWTAATGSGTITYTVLRSTTSGSGYVAVTGGSGLTGTTFTDPTGGTALTNGTTYYYVVQAANGGGTSNNSAQAAVTPAVPALLLVKRITAINGVAITGFVSDGAGKDTNAYWPSPSSTYLRGGLAATAKPGDTVEYTLYFLAIGSGSVTSVVVSNVLPDHVNFAASAYNSLTPTDGGSGNSGLALALSAASYPSAPTIYLSNTADSDRGTYYAPGVAVSGICTALQNVSGVIAVNVVTSPTTLPAATSASSPYNSYGFVRYQVTIR